MPRPLFSQVEFRVGGAVVSCTTDGSGQCSITLSNINKRINSVTLTVNSVSAAGCDYAAGDNHDPDGDSDGTTIVMISP